MNDLLGPRESTMDRKDTETIQLEEFIKRKYEVVAEIMNCSLVNKVAFFDPEFRDIPFLHDSDQVSGPRLHPGEAIY